MKAPLSIGSSERVPVPSEKRFLTSSQDDVYSREGLEGASHRVEKPIKPGTVYNWAVRTRKGDEVGDWNRYVTRVFLVLYYHVAKDPLTFRTP